MTNTNDATLLNLSMKAGDMLNMLGNTLLFASKDDTLPVLCALKLEVSGSEVTAYGTDRYRLARVRMPLSLTEGDWSSIPEVLMDRSVVERFVKLLKGEKLALKQGYDAHLIAKVERGVLVSWEVVAGDTRATAPQYITSAFPKLKSLFPSSAPSEPCGLMAFSSAFLVDMGKVKDLAVGGRDHEPIRLVGASSSNKPTSFYKYDWFEGLLMPTRLPADAEYGNYNLAA